MNKTKPKIKIKITESKILEALSKLNMEEYPDYMSSEISSLLVGGVPEKEIAQFLKPLVIATIKLWIDEFKLKESFVRKHLLKELIPAGIASQEKIKTQISSFALAMRDELTVEEKRSLIVQHSDDSVTAVAGIISFYILQKDLWRGG